MPWRIDPDSSPRRELLDQPESGMGYQLVAGADAVVFNAEIVCWLEDRKLTADDRNWLVEFLFQHNSQPDMLGRLAEYTDPVEVVSHGSYPSTTRAGETLVRYSAFWPDRRIRPDGSVLKGTYATTASDTPLVPSGLAAVGRYALPNPAPAVYSYTLVPPTGTAILCGTCAPLFGQAGGGVEIRIDVPLPTRSVGGPPSTIAER